VLNRALLTNLLVERNLKGHGSESIMSQLPRALDTLGEDLMLLLPTPHRGRVRHVLILANPRQGLAVTHAHKYLGRDLLVVFGA
jgi:hypothetical protein